MLITLQVNSDFEKKGKNISKQGKYKAKGLKK